MKSEGRYVAKTENNHVIYVTAVSYTHLIRKTPALSPPPASILVSPAGMWNI